jgi:transposase InsO family protein
VSHRNARLTFHGRLMLVQRVLDDERPVAHVAKEMGVSRQCGHKWVARYRAAGEPGLQDRSSRPRSTPTRTPAEVEDIVVAARREHRLGPDRLSPELGVPARTITRILRRHDEPRLCECDPLTGEVIRASKTTAIRYERDRPGELVHMDVKKIGRIPDGGGWRAHGRAMGRSSAQKKAKIGFDYVHSMVDDHSRYAYSEVLDDETAPSCAGFFQRAVAAFDAAGIDRICEVMTDNHWSYTKSNALAAHLTELGAKHRLIKPHCPWQNGKVERLNRTLQTEWAYRRIYRSNAERAAALAPWLEDYNNHRRHSALGALPPISRLSPT